MSDQNSTENGPNELVIILGILSVSALAYLTGLAAAAVGFLLTYREWQKRRQARSIS
jgi:hypothetical protein